MKQPGELVSIIIVVKNERGIDATLKEIYANQSIGSTKFETIVIDSSKPERLADIRDKYPQVRWVQYPYSTHRTTPHQRNRGLELATGEIIVFIDANCIPERGWLSAMVTSIGNGEDIVCGPVYDLNRGNLVHYDTERTSPGYVDVCTTINVGLRRRVVERVGGFDESFLFGQDIDYFWRAREAGFKIYFNPAVAIGHDWGKPKEQFRRAYEYGRARAHLYKKHWRTHRGLLLHEPHVWAYPLFILGLPFTLIFPFYPLLLLIPVLKNVRQNPIGLVSHHLSYGWGVLIGTITIWPKGNTRVALKA